MADGNKTEADKNNLKEINRPYLKNGLGAHGGLSHRQGGHWQW